MWRWLFIFHCILDTHTIIKKNMYKNFTKAVTKIISKIGFSLSAGQSKLFMVMIGFGCFGTTKPH